MWKPRRDLRELRAGVDLLTGRVRSAERVGQHGRRRRLDVHGHGWRHVVARWRRAWQELTSGTRLRAIHLTGADGSKPPLAWGLNVSSIFWDSQLSLYCTTPSRWSIPEAQLVDTPPSSASGTRSST